MRDFAEEIFQIENSTEDLYEFLHHFLTVDLEEISVYGGMEKEEQFQKVNEDVTTEIRNYLQEQSQKNEFNFIEDKFNTVFNRVKDIYER